MTGSRGCEALWVQSGKKRNARETGLRECDAALDPSATQAEELARPIYGYSETDRIRAEAWPCRIKDVPPTAFILLAMACVARLSCRSDVAAVPAPVIGFSGVLRTTELVSLRRVPAQVPLDRPSVVIVLRVAKNGLLRYAEQAVMIPDVGAARFVEHLLRKSRPGVARKEQELLDEAASLYAKSKDQDRRLEELTARKSRLERQRAPVARGQSTASSLAPHRALARAFGDLGDPQPWARKLDDPLLQVSAALL
ncbi:unnamed protein product, partial [Prorocentrum cordatum]